MQMPLYSWLDTACSGAADQALKSFLAAVNAQPKDPVGYRALTEFYLGQKNYDEAIKVVRMGLQQQPDSIGSAHDLGRRIGAEGGL